jgi:hypothetical protein
MIFNATFYFYPTAVVHYRLRHKLYACLKPGINWACYHTYIRLKYDHNAQHLLASTSGHPNRLFYLKLKQSLRFTLSIPFLLLSTMTNLRNKMQRIIYIERIGCQIEKIIDVMNFSNSKIIKYLFLDFDSSPMLRLKSA